MVFCNFIESDAEIDRKLTNYVVRFLEQLSIVLTPNKRKEKDYGKEDFDYIVSGEIVCGQP